MENPSGFVNDIFEKFPLTRDWFYDGYKNNATTQEGEDGNLFLHLSVLVKKIICFCLQTFNKVNNYLKTYIKNVNFIIM